MSATSEQIWSRWMAAAQAGDAQSYRMLLNALQGWLRGFFARRAPASWTDDLIQETLIALHNRRHTFDPAMPFLPWIRAIARYKWIDMLRRHVRWAETELTDDVADHTSGAFGILAGEVVRQMLTQLSPNQAAAINAVKLDGLTIEEASQLTGQSPSLVKVNIHRGLKKLTELLEQGD